MQMIAKTEQTDEYVISLGGGFLMAVYPFLFLDIQNPYLRLLTNPNLMETSVCSSGKGDMYLYI
jgi:hypothetical protein